MRLPRFTILSILIATAIFAYFISGYSSRLHEADRIKKANHENNILILQRCQGIAELRQFIDLYNPKPESVLEFFDNDDLHRVVSVTCVTPIDDRYRASFLADVQINEEGVYDLTDEMKFVIKDRDGVFTVIENKNLTSTSQSVFLTPAEWADFVAGGADIESIRTINRATTNMPALEIP